MYFAPDRRPLVSVDSPSNYPARVGRFTAGQIAQRSTWAGVPDADTALAAMTTIRVVPAGGSTITVVNPLDPVSAADAQHGEAGWLSCPSAPGSVWSHRPASWML